MASKKHCSRVKSYRVVTVYTSPEAQLKAIFVDLTTNARSLIYLKSLCSDDLSLTPKSPWSFALDGILDLLEL